MERVAAMLRAARDLTQEERLRAIGELLRNFGDLQAQINALEAAGQEEEKDITQNAMEGLSYSVCICRNGWMGCVANSTIVSTTTTLAVVMGQTRDLRRSTIRVLGFRYRMHGCYAQCIILSFLYISFLLS
jgi:hypothetical protein